MPIGVGFFGADLMTGLGFSGVFWADVSIVTSLHCVLRWVATMGGHSGRSTFGALTLRQ